MTDQFVIYAVSESQTFRY